MLRLLCCCAAVVAVAASAVPWDGEGPNPYPAAPSTGSFCDRLATANGYNYTDASHSFALMLQFVSRAYNGADKNTTLSPPVVSFVQGLLRNSNTLAYFNGEKDYRVEGTPYYAQRPAPAYTNDKALAYALDEKLVAWFGGPDAFGCTGRDRDTGLSFSSRYPYTGSLDMVSVHAGMSVTGTVFAAFIGQFAASATSLGAQDYDFQNSVVPYLTSFARGAAGRLGICNDEATCPCATGFQGAKCDEPIPPPTPPVKPGDEPKPADLSAATRVAAPALGLVAASVAALATLLL